jgi:methylsterol monooxygenase/4-alpha-methyl-delta7-sterol-4alpha-methyl oxidase
LFRHINSIHLGELPAWYIIIGQLIFFIILDDFLYYWMHRSMHQRWILRHIHGVHHRIKNTCALDGNYFHWVEFVATGLLALVPPLLVGAHLYVLYIWIIIRQFEAADGHSGYDFPNNPAKLIPGYHGAIYHDFHHAKFKGNFAGFLSYLDRWMGNTYIPSYLTYQANRKKGLPPAEANENNPSRQRLSS